MHIKSLIIDGFKSYGKRVELNDFDPEFNAITGLNGTGKSNILDAICFTLGISAMNTIRAATMQDVIYKSGQAGVHTATVTIKFDNKDKSRSAPNYKHNDEIIISREVGMGSKNVYRINGLTVPLKKVMDFFNSLQMNVNNPHFIIMQGRITKVLNMKPIEILSMIEEAAGTNMYESKKKTLVTTVDKKDYKLKEMQTVANEEIGPTMQNIDRDKQMVDELYMVKSEFKKQEEKLENWTYVKTKIRVKKTFEAIETMKSAYQILVDNKKSLTECRDAAKKQLLTMEEAFDNNTNIKLIEFKTELEKEEKVKIAAQHKVNICKDNLSSQGKKIKDIEKQINGSKKDFKAKKKEMEEFNDINAGLVEDNKKNTDDLNEIDKKIRLLNSGNIFGDDDNGLVQENINTFNLKLQTQQTENQQCAIKIDGLRTKLNTQLTGMREAQKLYDMQMAQLTAKENEYEKVKMEFQKANEELSGYNSLKLNYDNLGREIRELNLKIESFESNNSSLVFKYKDPRANFDRRKVHGLICRLFHPIDFKFELALTTLAGGKLYYCVVDDDTVGNDILETNKFPNRMHFMPISKIRSDSLPATIINIAQQIGGADNVFPAMSLIKFDKKHLKAIQWVFGQAFICTSKGIAEKVCFDPRVNKHCFTLEGDHFNPSGSLTGGANTQRLILKTISIQDEIKSQYEAKKSEFLKIEAKLSAIANLPDKVARLKDQHLTVQGELDRIRSDVHLSKPHQQVTEVNNIKQQIVELETNLSEGKANEKQLQSKIKDLELKMKNAKNILKQQLSDTEKTRKIILAKIINNKTEYEKKKDNYNQLELEIKDLTSYIQSEENQLAELNAEKGRFEEQLKTLMSEFDKTNSVYMEAYYKYESQKEAVLKTSNDIEVLRIEYKKLLMDIESNEVKTLELDGEINKNKKMLEEIQELLNKLEQKMSNEQKQIAEKMDYTNFDFGKILHTKL